VGAKPHEIDLKARLVHRANQRRDIPRHDLAEHFVLLPFRALAPYAAAEPSFHGPEHASISNENA
jgi:hypothetical protein